MLSHLDQNFPWNGRFGNVYKLFDRLEWLPQVEDQQFSTYCAAAQPRPSLQMSARGPLSSFPENFQSVSQSVGNGLLKLGRLRVESHPWNIVDTVFLTNYSSQQISLYEVK